jgi:hypothetical protein
MQKITTIIELEQKAGSIKPGTTVKHQKTNFVGVLGYQKDSRLFIQDNDAKKIYPKPSDLCDIEIFKQEVFSTDLYHI